MCSNPHLNPNQDLDLSPFYRPFFTCTWASCFVLVHLFWNRTFKNKCHWYFYGRDVLLLPNQQYSTIQYDTLYLCAPKS